MILSSGTRLGPYGILSPIGAGGMGKVYCASNPYLKREGAIKNLLEAVAQDIGHTARTDNGPSARVSRLTLRRSRQKATLWFSSDILADDQRRWQ